MHAYLRKLAQVSQLPATFTASMRVQYVGSFDYDDLRCDRCEELQGAILDCRTFQGVDHLYVRLRLDNCDNPLSIPRQPHSRQG